MSSTDSSSSSSFVGQVKWFNNRLGYGFITIVSEGARQNEDIFVHQQHITPKTSDYRTLHQGEYVSFQLGTADSSAEGSEAAKHVNQAVKVTGVFGGSLMCDQASTRAPPQQQQQTDGGRKPAPRTSAPRGGMRGGRPPRVNHNSE
jgi:cold shock CspA family protein